MTVIVTGNETCWKCGGSGMFYGGGIVENGVYKGYSGDLLRLRGQGHAEQRRPCAQSLLLAPSEGDLEGAGGHERGEIPRRWTASAAEKMAHDDAACDAPVKVPEASTSRRRRSPIRSKKLGEPNPARACRLSRMRRVTD